MSSSDRSGEDGPRRSAGQRILFLYLNTGGGHLAPARALKGELERRYPGEVSVDLLNGFGPRQFVSHLFFEGGYRAAYGSSPGAYSAFYDLTCWGPALHCTKQCCSWRTVPYLAEYIRSHTITKVVSFHFAVAPAALRAIRRVDPSIPFLVTVTDPFSAHPAWLLVRDQRYVVFSDKLKDEFVSRYDMAPSRIQVLPFITNPAFSPASDVRALKAKYDLSPHKKTLLITGGAEGLSRSFDLVRTILARRADFSTIVVCGRNERLRKRIEALLERAGVAGGVSGDFRVFGYVDFMSELVQLSDCVVTKAGASTLMEVLSCRKPVVSCEYIHGQELENVRFLTRSGAGTFIREPEDICSAVERLFSDDAYRARFDASIGKLPLNVLSARERLSIAADYILRFPEV